MKLYELAEKMKIGNIRVFERDEPDGFAQRKFTYPANSPLKHDFYYAEVEYFSIKDSTICAIVKRSNDNG